MRPASANFFISGSQKCMVVIILGAILTLCLLTDLHLTMEYGGVDLRDKVVGARSLLEGRSLYFEPWSPGESEKLADPLVSPGLEMTRFTGTPFQALIMAPMGLVHYPVLRMFWLFLQYILFFLIALLMYRTFSKEGPVDKWATVILLLVILVSSSWRLHVERGQIYILLALLIAGLFISVQRRQHVVTGILGASVVLIKPPFGLLLLPMIFCLHPRMLLGGVLLLAIALPVFLLLENGITAWQEFPQAMSIYAAEPVYAKDHFTPAAFDHPEMVESAGNLALFHSMEMENSSITLLLRYNGLYLPPIVPPVLLFLFMAAIFMAGWKRLKAAPPADLLLLGFCFSTLFMMFAPALRFQYQFVLWLPGLLYMVFTYRNAPGGWYVALAIAGSLLVGAWEVLPVNSLLAELILLALAAHYLLFNERHSAKGSTLSSSAPEAGVIGASAADHTLRNTRSKNVRSTLISCNSPSR